MSADLVQLTRGYPDSKDGLGPGRERNDGFGSIRDAILLEEGEEARRKYANDCIFSGDVDVESVGEELVLVSAEDCVDYCREVLLGCIGELDLDGLDDWESCIVENAGAERSSIWDRF